MNSSSVRWVQGAVVLHIDPSAVVDAKELVRQTDYVLLDMMGKIKHRADGLPAVWPNYKSWPFRH